MFDTRIKEAAKIFASKSHVDNDFYIAEKNREEIKKLQTFNLSHFIGKSYFENDRLKDCLIFQPNYNTFTRPAVDTETIIAWKSKGLSYKLIKTPTAPSNILASKLKWIQNS